MLLYKFFGDKHTML